MSQSLRTIFALSTVHGRSGVAVIRITGPEAGHVLDVMAPPRPLARQAALRTVRHPQSRVELDRGIVLFFNGPRSETGEDVAEFQLHGSRAVIRAVLDALGRMPGCRIAEPGEFARRAFENGKLDLTAAEGLADLIEAETEVQRRQALRQASGGLAQLYEGWRTALIEAAALVEAGIDFSDEADVSSRAFDMARERVVVLETAVRRHANDAGRGEIVRGGFRVVLAGPPNAGKSSLLNALAKRDVAIVSEEAGTTRDVIEVHLDLDGLPVIVSDTAGIREAEGKVEAEGIRRTLARALEADLVLWLTDATTPAATPPDELLGVGWVRAQGRGESSPEAAVTQHGAEGGDVGLRADQAPALSRQSSAAPTQPTAFTDSVLPLDGGDNCRFLVVRTKVDLVPSVARDGGLAVSSNTGHGVAELTARIASIAAERIGTGEGPVITQARHRRLVGECASGLADFLAGDPAAVELRAEDLRRAAQALGRVTGRIDVEDVLDQVFSRFCIGK